MYLYKLLTEKEQESLKLPDNYPNYPTAEEIIKSESKHKTIIIKMIFGWKKEIWYPLRKKTDIDDNKREELKIKAISDLIISIANIYKKEVNVTFEPGVFSSFYNPETQTIGLNKPSIVSALHELAHHLFGPDEIKACKWSVHLFRKTFPKAYQELQWYGHVLIKPDLAMVKNLTPKLKEEKQEEKQKEKEIKTKK